MCRGSKISFCIPLFYIFFTLNIAILSDSDVKKTAEVGEFLEKLHQTIKKLISSQASLMKRKLRDRDLKVKAKVRKQIVRKLANPFVQFRRAHTIIDYNPKQKPVSALEKNRGVGDNEQYRETDNKSLATTINRFIKEDSQFNPFKIPSINNLLSHLEGSNGTFTNNQQIKDHPMDDKKNTGNYDYLLPFMEELRKWYEEVAYKVVQSWGIIEEFFVKDQKRKDIFLKTVCYHSSDVKIDLFRDSCSYYAVSNEQLVMSPISGLMVVNTSCKPSEYLTTVKTKLNFFDVFSPLSNDLFTDYGEIEITKSSFLKKINKESSLCSDIYYLNKFYDLLAKSSRWGYRGSWGSLGCILNYYFFIDRKSDVAVVCGLNSIGGFQDIEVYISSLLKDVYSLTKVWFKKFEFVIRMKIVPALQNYMLGVSVNNREGESRDGESPANGDLLTMLFYRLIKDRIFDISRFITPLTGGDLSILASINMLLNNYNCKKLGYDDWVNGFWDDAQSVLAGSKIGDNVRMLYKDNSNGFFKLMDDLMNGYPHLFFKITKLPSFHKIMTIVDDFENSTIEAIANGKDVYCNALALMKYYVLKESNNVAIYHPAMVEVYIGTTNSSSLPLTLPPPEDKDILLDNLLKDVQNLDYVIYSLYSDYRVGKCLKNSESMNNIKDYVCVLEGGNLDCSDSLYLKEIHRFLRDATRTDGIGLYNYSDVVKKLKGKRYRDIKEIDMLCKELETSNRTRMVPIQDPMGGIIYVEVPITSSHFFVEKCLNNSVISFVDRENFEKRYKSIIGRIIAILGDIKKLPLEVERECK